MTVNDLSSAKTSVRDFPCIYAVVPAQLRPCESIPRRHIAFSPALRPYSNTAVPSSYPTMAENSTASPCTNADAARRMFLVQHGPGAAIRRRATIPKQMRKALLAAEMARWDGF